MGNKSHSPVIWGSIVFSSLVLVVLLSSDVRAGQLKKIAVLELSAKSGIKQAQLDVLGDMIATELRSMGKFEVVTKDDIRAMLGLEKAKEFLGCTDASCMADIGGALGVDGVISGNVARFGHVFAVNLKLIDIHEVKVKNSVFEKVEGGEQALLECFSSMVHRLVGGDGAPKAAMTGGLGRRDYSSRGGLAGLGFGSDLLERIQEAGYSPTSGRMVRVAKRLLNRGFTPEDITELVINHDLLSYGAEKAELFAVYYLVGLKPKAFNRFLRSRMDLTAYYNRLQESTGLEVAKWITFGMGVLMALNGAMFYGLNSAAPSDDMLETAHAFMGTAAILLTASVTIMIVDGIDIGYLPERFLDKAKKQEIIEKLGNSARKISWFGPMVIPDASFSGNGTNESGFGLGVGFGFTF